MLLALKSVDPSQVSDALAAVYGGCIAVLAVLKLQFAAAVTLGNSLGDIAARAAAPAALPLVSAALPAEYKKWAEPLFRYACKAGGVSLAWWLQRVLSAFHSAFRGAEMFVACALVVAARRGYIIDRNSDGKSDIEPG